MRNDPSVSGVGGAGDVGWKGGGECKGEMYQEVSRVWGREGQPTWMSSGEVPGSRGSSSRAMLTEPREEAMASSISPEATRSATCGTRHTSQREMGVGRQVCEEVTGG